MRYWVKIFVIILSYVLATSTIHAALSDNDIYNMYQSSKTAKKLSGATCLTQNDFEDCQKAIEDRLDKAKFDDCRKTYSLAFCIDAHTADKSSVYFKHMYDIAISNQNTKQLIKTVLLSKGRYLTEQQTHHTLTLLKNQTGKLADLTKYILYKDNLRASTQPNMAAVADRHLQQALFSVGVGESSYDDMILSAYLESHVKQDFEKYYRFIDKVNRCGASCKADVYYLKFLALVKTRQHLQRFYEKVLNCRSCDKPRLLGYLSGNPAFGQSVVAGDFIKSLEYNVLRRIGYDINFRARKNQAIFELSYTALASKNHGMFQDIPSKKSMSVYATTTCTSSGESYSQKKDLGSFEGMFSAPNIVAKKVTYQDYACQIPLPRFVTSARSTNNLPKTNRIKWRYSKQIDTQPIYGQPSPAAYQANTAQPTNKNNSGAYQVIESYMGGFGHFGLAKPRTVTVIRCTGKNVTALITTNEAGNRWYRLDGMSISTYDSFKSTAKSICR